MSGGAATILRIAASLLVVVVLALLAARFARRVGVRGSGAGLRVVDRVGLTRETAVAVVEVAGRALLVGTSAHGVTLLAELDPDEVTPRREHSGHSAHKEHKEHRERQPPEAGRVTVTRVPTPAATRVLPAQRGTGAALDPRTWRQGLDALRDLTVRRG